MLAQAGQPGSVAGDCVFVRHTRMGVIPFMNPINTLLINPSTGELKCKICGTTFYSPVKPLVGEIYYHTSFHCPNGCMDNHGPDLDPAGAVREDIRH